MTELRPYKYQREGRRLIEKFNGRVLLADEMRLGKSVQVLMWLAEHPEFRPVVIICPSDSKWVWEELAWKWNGERCEVAQGLTPPPEGMLAGTHRILIINYDILASSVRGERRFQGWGDYLTSIKPSVLIVDEVHHMKDPSTKWTKSIRKLSRQIPHIIAISGTPFLSRHIELYTTLNMLWPQKFPRVFDFAFEFCKPRRTRWGWDFRQSCNHTKLHNLLTEMGMVRRTWKEVFKDVPEPEVEIVPLDINNRGKYDRAEEDFISFLEEISMVKALKAKKAQEIVKRGYLLRLAARGKLKQVYKWVDNFLEAEDGKLIIFGVHRKVIRKIYKRYRDKSLRLDGGVAKKFRRDIVKRFHSDPHIRILVGNIKVMSESLDLSKANTAIFVEFGWTPGNIKQAMLRLLHVKNNTGKRVCFLVSRNTVEEILCRILQDKQKTLDKTLDGKGDKEGTLDIYDQLKKELKRGRNAKPI